MKKLLFLTIAAILALPIGLSAQNARILKKGDKKPDEYKEIKMRNPQTYSVSYLKGGGGVVPVDQVVYAWIPKPQEVKDADTLRDAGKAQDAANAYLAAAKQYKILGWDAYCRFEAALALNVAKQYDESIKLLDAMRKEQFANPDDADYPNKAAVKLGEVYMTAEKYSLALNYAQEQSKLKDDLLAGPAYLLCGKIYRMQANAATDDDTKRELLLKSAYAYFGAALLFKDAKTRPEALYFSWEVLKDLKDARAEEFAKILRAEYPSNEYTKRLK